MKQEPLVPVSMLIIGLFLVLSLMCVLYSASIYSSTEASESLDFNNRMNIVVSLVFILAWLPLRKKEWAFTLISGMHLLILYNLIPVFILSHTPAIRIGAAVTGLSALALFMAGLSAAPEGIRLPGGRVKRILYGVILILFSLIFCIRGINTIRLHTAGAAPLTETSVAIADIATSIIWLTTGIVCTGKKKPGGRIILPVYIQASLLFITLIAYMIINPLILNEPVDIAGVVTITVMAVLFVFPAADLIRLQGREG